MEGKGLRNRESANKIAPNAVVQSTEVNTMIANCRNPFETNNLNLLLEVVEAEYDCRFEDFESIVEFAREQRNDDQLTINSMLDLMNEKIK